MNAQLKGHLEVGVEPFSRELYAEVLPLLEEHWKEVALYKDRIALEVDVDFYLRLASLGRLLFVAVRRETVLVGYAVFFLAPHPHYKSLMVARNDVIYVDQENRARIALRLIHESERAIRAKTGSRLTMITWHAKMSNEFSTLLQRLGYSVNEVSLGKLL